MTQVAAHHEHLRALWTAHRDAGDPLHPSGAARHVLCLNSPTRTYQPAAPTVTITVDPDTNWLEQLAAWGQAWPAGTRVAVVWQGDATDLLTRLDAIAAVAPVVALDAHAATAVTADLRRRLATRAWFKLQLPPCRHPVAARVLTEQVHARWHHGGWS